MASSRSAWRALFSPISRRHPKGEDRYKDKFRDFSCDARYLFGKTKRPGRPITTWLTKYSNTIRCHRWSLSTCCCSICRYKWAEHCCLFRGRGQVQGQMTRFLMWRPWFGEAKQPNHAPYLTDNILVQLYSLLPHWSRCIISFSEYLIIELLLSPTISSYTLYTCMRSARSELIKLHRGSEKGMTRILNNIIILACACGPPCPATMPPPCI